MTKSLITIFAGAALAFSSGCATKNYVRKEMSPTVGKINELDELTAKTTNEIRDVDSRAQKGIADVNTKAAAVDLTLEIEGRRPCRLPIGLHPTFRLSPRPGSVVIEPGSSSTSQ